MKPTIALWRSHLTAAAVVLCVLSQATRLLADATRLVDFAAADAVSHIAPNGAGGVDFTPTDGPKGRGLEVHCVPAANSFPGVVILPAGAAAWDLSSYGDVEADVTNLSDDRLPFVLRVDNPIDAQAGAWDGERLAIAPGKTGTIKAVFGYSWGNPGAKIDPSRISRLLVFTSKAKKELKFRIEAIRASGKPGMKPAGLIEKLKPADGVLIDFGTAFTPSQMESRGAKSALTQEGGSHVAQIMIPKASNKPAGTFFKAPDGFAWDLSDYTQCDVSVHNPGAVPIHVACGFENTTTAQVTVEPGGKKTIATPFASAQPWDGENKGSGSRIGNDRVSGVLVVADAGPEAATIDVEGIRASVGAGAPLPEWLGQRPPEPGAWTKTLDEDFNGTSLNPKLWFLPEKPEASIWDSAAVNVAKNSYLEDGFLKMKCEKPADLKFDDPKLQGRKYLTSVVTSFDKWAQRYGYFEARMKLPTAMGMWPAFWLMPDRGAAAGNQWKRQDTKNGGMEFDIMEYLVRFGPYHYNIALHWDGYSKDHKFIGTENIYFHPDSQGFITSGMLWEPGKVTFYCNGTVVGTWKNERISNLPAYILFTMPVGGWGTNGIVGDEKLPDYFTIDYVRAWQRDDLKEPVPGAASAGSSLQSAAGR